MLSVVLVFVLDVTNTDTNETISREERAQFYYRPERKSFEQLDGGTFRSMFHKVVALSEDRKTAQILNGGQYKDASFEFGVRDVGKPQVIKGGAVVEASVVFSKRPEGVKIRTADDRWVTPVLEEQVRLYVPFFAE